MLDYFEWQHSLQVCTPLFFIFFPPWNSEITVKDFSKQCVLHIGLMQWNMGRDTRVRTKSGSHHWALSLHKKRLCNKRHMIMYYVFCMSLKHTTAHVRLSWFHTFDYVAFFKIWIYFHTSPPAWMTKNMICQCCPKRLFSDLPPLWLRFGEV